MCFSAEVSFGAGLVLSGIGVASIKQAEPWSSVPYASIPLLFGLQQVAEGVLWLALFSEDMFIWQQAATYVFLTFALILWPIWIPFSTYLLENQVHKKRMLLLSLAIGLLLSFLMVYGLVVYPVLAFDQCGHIEYYFEFPMVAQWVGSFLYFIPSVFSTFMSSYREVRLFGAALIGSFILTKFLFPEHVVSVWCFFAALLSVVIYLGVKRFNVSLEVDPAMEYRP